MSILILGGQGPLATQLFLQKLLARLNEAGVAEDKDYPLITTINDPEFALAADGIMSEDLLETYLSKYATQVETHNHIVFPCNSFYSYHSNLPNRFKDKIVSLPILARQKLEGQQVLFLGSQQSKNTRLYESDKYTLVYPAQNETEELISNILHEPKAYYEDSIKTMVEDYDFDLILLGCTELELISDTFKNLGYSIVEPMDLAISYLVEKELAS